MRIKGRLKQILEYISPVEGKIYDLFCDHGLLGEALLHDQSCHVIFNDKRGHLIDRIKERHIACDNATFEVCDAAEIIFDKNSKVVMAGVGGLTMISCFKAWEKAHESEVMESLEFFVSPHYYCFELRNFLLSRGFEYKGLILIEEGRQIYELARVVKKSGEESSPLFEVEVWKSFGDVGLKYLSFTLKNLTNKSTLSEWERELLENIKELINECNSLT